jgi:hypothetical protein
VQTSLVAIGGRSGLADRSEHAKFEFAPALRWFATFASVSLCGCLTQKPPVQGHAAGGSEAPAPRGLSRLTALPVGAQSLGRLSAECTLVEPRSGFARLSLGALDCSTALLTRALDEAARSAGATVLVGQICSAEQKSTSGPQATEIECEATAATLPSGLEPTPSPCGPEDSDTVPLAAAIEFASFVDFQPKDATRKSSSTAFASEVPRQPAADFRLGALRIVVTVPATRSDVLGAVRIAARRIGARHFETPHCVERRTAVGWECTAWLYTPERDERVVRAAQ